MGDMRLMYGGRQATLKAKVVRCSVSMALASEFGRRSELQIRSDATGVGVIP